MPIIPRSTTLTASSVDILNAIRNSATANYRDYVPAADPSADSVRQIGQVIMQIPALQNEFLTALVNRIGRVILSSKLYDNPWAVFKRGLLEFGESIEEIFVNIAKPYQFDPAVAESEVFKREIPDVRAAFHVLNYQKFYKSTISQDQLRQAFLSWDGINDLISKIVTAMYTSANYDEFNAMKYMLALHILHGEMFPVQVPDEGESTQEMLKTIVSTIKGISNNFEFMNPKYNLTGVATYTEKNDQYIIVNANFDAIMDVEVLASAFNMDKADFMGHRIMIDSFGNLDTERIEALFGNDPDYEALTSDQLAALDAIPAVLVDKNWFMIFDNLFEFTEQYNGQGLYWNYWYHTWKTFSISPFANAAVFVPDVPAVTGVTVSPDRATIMPGSALTLTATVATTGFAPQAVNWTATVSGEAMDGVTITPLGVLSVGPDVESGTVINVTATSVYNPDVSGTSAVTVG